MEAKWAVSRGWRWGQGRERVCLKMGNRRMLVAWELCIACMMDTRTYTVMKLLRTLHTLKHNEYQ